MLTIVYLIFILSSPPSKGGASCFIEKTTASERPYPRRGQKDIGNRILGSGKYRQGVGSLESQWLRLCASTTRGTGSVPGWGTKDPTCYMAQAKQNQRTEEDSGR